MNKSEYMTAKREIFDLIMSLDPEDGLDTMIGCEQNQGGDYDSFWKAEELKKFLGLDEAYDNSPMAKAIKDIDNAYWELQAKECQFSWDIGSVKELLNQIEDEKIQHGFMTPFDILRDRYPREEKKDIKL